MTNLKYPFYGLCFLIAWCYQAWPQGTFLNLDFESANVQDLPYPGPGEAVNISDGVPGWNVSPTIGLDQMGHNSFSIGGAAVEILGPAWPSSQLLQGSYTVALYASVAGPPVVPDIFQTGQIPAGSQSLRFYGAGDFGLTFGGQSISLVQVGSAPNYKIFGGVISAFAGQTGLLVFTGNGLLDNIAFSPTAIPEPSVVGVLVAGGLLLAWLSVRRLSVSIIRILQLCWHA